MTFQGAKCESGSWGKLMESAIRAPSPHNVQPWKLRVASDSDATLYVDMNRALPAEDSTGSFLLSAMGIFVEALQIAAHARSFELSISMCEPPAKLAPRIATPSTSMIPFARLTLTRMETECDDFALELLDARSTGRTTYGTLPLSVDTGARLRKAASDAAVQFGVTSDVRMVRLLLDLNTWAVFHDLNAPYYHDEIAQWFRCTAAEEMSTRDGLSYRCMNMHPWEMKVAKYYPRLLQIPLASAVFARRYSSQNRCGNIGYLSGPFFEDPDAAVALGRGLMRFWLAVAAAGLSIHPLGNLVTNPQAAQRVESVLNVRQIWLIFKIGQLLRAAPRSLRRPVEEFLLP
jgi:nitroreductase